MKRIALATALLLAAHSSYASERIISAGAAITEIINAMGAQEQLVAVDVTSKNLVNEEMPVLGYHRQLSAESLIALTPTRLLGSNEMGPRTTLDLIQQAGIEVDVVNSGETVDDLLSRIEQVGKLTHTEKEALKLQAHVQEKIDSINQTLAQQTEKKKVMFLMIHEGRPANVAGRNTTADSVIRLAGAINPAASAVESYKPISLEAMVEMQPDIILLSSRTLSQIGSADDLLKQMPLLAATPAGRNKAVVTIDGTALIGGLGLKSLSEAERLNKAFYQQ
ncbi:heme/hemin ABC transporter substrate-binding protein [Photobacterium sp. DNB23_23_1]|uniref:ABC transporter substrate-binding protein n=1 Tax=Photobacterium pectinilyticum TaxID=2906793 RepID=A0ABT1N154_9GAMM|nr:ABC transporter substrate-binding protein [Photobacterium sp. ZSDE20]MCQ1058476.1 ABC transporter substrate-binding protein [Photobacterium sp. ZSDE20]MDD1823199.1 ABC transporter substrate-binding protein [Photobacterium sp. ZSDE20]